MSTQDVIEKEDSSRQLMKDCHELRRRLILTEESLRSLSSEQDTQSNLGDQTVSYERPQSASGFFLQGPSKAKLNFDMKQFDSPSRTASLPDINFSTGKTSAKHPMNSSQSSVHLHQMNEKISYMAQVIKEKDIQIRDLHFIINDKDSEIDKLSYDISIVNEELKEERRLRKSIEEKLRESLYTGEELQEQLIDLKNHIQLEKDKNAKEVNKKLLEIEDDRRVLAEQGEQLKLNLEDYKSLRETNHLLHDELKLKDTFIEEIQKQLTYMKTLQEAKDELGKENEVLRKRIEAVQIENNELMQENEKLKAGKEDMKATIYAYEESLKQANYKLKTNEEQANSVSKSPATVNSESHDGVSKISKAEFELKLAVKDAEIHKLQAALLSRAATNRKAKSVEGSDGPLEGSGLRSEFAAFLERSKAGDRKQQDLERIISQLEDDVAKYTDEIMVLEERLTDKLSYISLLEGKLEQKNSRMTLMQNEIKASFDNKTELEKQLQSNSNEILKKEKELQSYKERLSECTMQIGSFESAVGEKIKLIAHLEDAIKMNESEAKQANNLIEKIKSMNSENCQELQLQIDSLQEQLDIRNLELANLKANLQVLQQELDIKTSVCHDLEAKLNETQTQLEDRGSILMTYEGNLKKLSSSLKNETDNVGHLQKALSECKVELKILVEKAEKERIERINDANKQQRQIDQLETESKDTLMKLEARTKELNDTLESLHYRDEELQNVKDRIRELEGRNAELVEENQALTLKYQDEKSQVEKTLLDTKSKNNDLLNELSLRNKENIRLKVDLEEIQIRSGLEADRLEKLGKTVEKLDLEMKSQESLTRSFQSEAKEKESSHKVLLKKFQELKSKLASEEGLHHEASLKVKELEKELATVHSELKQTVGNLARLQLALIENEKEIQSKEETISIMDRKLNESEENIHYKDALLQEQSAKLSLLDKSMKEQQLELKQKAVEVTQLDMSMKEQHSQLQHRLSTTEEELRSTTDELSERLTQLAELQAKIELTEEKLQSRNSEMDNMQKTVQQQNKQLKEKTIAEAEMQREINSLKYQLEDKSNLEQQLHAVNEERNHIFADLVHLRTELSRKCQIEEELTGELDDCHVLLQAKEADCTRLAKNLGASQVREAEQEAKLMYELQKVRQNLEFKNLRQQQEAEKVSSEQSKRLAEKEKQIVSLQAKIQHVADESKVQKNDMERLRRRVSEQDNQIKELSNQLQQKQHYADDLKENSLIKDAEIARLEARMSGYHRATRATYNDKLNKSYNL